MTAVDIRVKSLAAEALSIGDLSARTSVSPRSLRYYEEQGLLTPGRTPAGLRRFDAEAVDRVLLVQRLFAAGLTSAEIRPVLPALLGAQGYDASPLVALRTHRQRLAHEIARLSDTAEILDEVIEEHERL